MKHTCFLLILLLLSFFSKAQESNTYREYLASYNFSNHYDEGKVFKGSLEVKANSPHEFNNFSYFGTFQSLNKKSNEYISFKNLRPRHWLLGAGYYYNQFLESRDRYEIRLMQGTSFYFKLGKHSNIKNYLRIEERFQRSLGDGSWSDGYRFRYKLSTAITWDKHLLNFAQGLYIPISLEAFINLQKAARFNDILRLSFGLGYKVNEQWKVEADLVYKRTLDQGFDINSNNFLFRLRFFHTLKKGKGLLFKDNDLLELIEDL